MEDSLGVWALCLVFIKLVTVGPTTRNFIIDTTLKMAMGPDTRYPTGI